MHSLANTETNKSSLRTPQVKRIAIIGGGPACVAIYSELIRKYHADLQEVLIFDPSGMMNSEAFNSQLDSSIINTSIGITSISSNDPLDLYRWVLDKRKGEYSPQGFIPRRYFREYCLDRFNEAKNFAKAFGCQTTFRQEKISFVDERNKHFIVTTESGVDYITDAVILATGGSYNDPYPEFNKHKNYVAVPYPEQNFLSKVKKEDRVLILGTHLSGIDVCIGLLENNPNCKIVLASPSGRLPAVKSEALLHPTKNFKSKKLLARPGNTLDRVYQAIQEDLGEASPFSPTNIPEHDLEDDINACQDQTAEWQDSIASFIDELNEIWPHLEESEKKDFRRDAGRFVTEILSSFPLCNAKKMLSGIRQGRVSIKKIDPNHFIRLNPNETFEGLGSLEGQTFDIVINATGLNKSFERHLNFKDGLPLHKSASQKEESLIVNSSMKVHVQGKNSPLYAIGGQTKHSSMMVTNYIRALAVTAKKIGEDIENYIWKTC